MSDHVVVGHPPASEGPPRIITPRGRLLTLGEAKAAASQYRSWVGNSWSYSVRKLFATDAEELLEDARETQQNLMEELGKTHQETERDMFDAGFFAASVPESDTVRGEDRQAAAIAWRRHQLSTAGG